MMHIPYTIGVLLALGCTVAFSREKESFYDQLSRAVVRLEHTEIIRNEQASRQPRIATGTGFFVGRGSELYIVTARHLVEKPYDLRARVQLVNLNSGKTAPFRLVLPRGEWVYHPAGGDKDTHYVDVAAMRIPFDQPDIPRCFLYDPTDPDMKKGNQLPLADAAPPEPVLIFGFPALLGFQLVEQRPLVRSGIISMCVGEEFLRYPMRNDPNVLKFAEERCCLVDARILGGNSGGPVMSQPRSGDRRTRLLGLVSAASETLDFGIIEPVSRIRETLDIVKGRPACGRWIPITDAKTVARPTTSN